MYPELEKAGGLSNALNDAFSQINSPFRTSTEEYIDKIPLTFTVVQNGNKFSQVYIAAEEKLYLPDFWRDGVCLAHGKTGTISDLAKVIDFWLSHDAATNVLAEKFTFVTPNEKARAFDENNEVAYAWNCLLHDDRPGITEFVELAMKDEILGKLFPFTSLYTLCFSRCTGYPYSTDGIPNVTPKDTTTFIVTHNKTEYLGEGNVVEALKLVKEHLPKDIKPAVKGTADDI